MDSNQCDTNSSFNTRRIIFKKRRLSFLNMVRDSMERRLAALTASIQTLETQIERDIASNTNE